MTLEAMQWHEAVTLRYSHDDYRRKSLVALVRPHVTGKRVLDLRCLTGHLSVDLATSGFKVTAFDGYQPAVDSANALAKEQGVAGSIAHLWDLTGLLNRTGEKQFDTVICMDVLNHVTDDEATIAEIAQVTAPGGRLIAVVPAFPALLGKRDRSLGHLRRYSREGFTRLLKRYGFVVEQLRFWNCAALPIYIVVEKIMRRRLSDGLRYGREGKLGGWPNRILGWWYGVVENRLFFPCGLSHFVIARRLA